jgi:hypothetical protein
MTESWKRVQELIEELIQAGHKLEWDSRSLSKTFRPGAIVWVRFWNDDGRFSAKEYPYMTNQVLTVGSLVVVKVMNKYKIVQVQRFSPVKEDDSNWTPNTNNRTLKWIEGGIFKLNNNGR